MPQGKPEFPRQTKYSCENCGAQSNRKLCYRCTALEEKKPVFDRAHARRREDEFGELDFNRA